jgi:tripartite-type tricarboxylate transporter receptor subunit TctC/2-polyprenyl-6-methoxyphenol hydroxylase-like FAD-dependent oxidoreductase
MQRVLIAGAGPVGLCAASVLADAGIPVTVLEAEPRLPENLRASTFQPPTLDLLARFGADRRLLEMGRAARKVQYRDRAGWVAEFDFGVIAGETAHPYRVQCEQFRLNQVLAERLPDVRYSSTVMGVEQDASSVTVTLAGGERLTGQWLIGADGAKSRVRAAIGIRLEGYTWPERFLVASTPFDFAAVFPNLCDVSYFADPEQWFFLLRVGDLWRVMIPTRPDEDEAQIVSDAGIEARLQRIFSRSSRYQVRHRTLYTVHQRVAESYRKGRVFLAGDAAHLNNPLGGMGMNGGIHDAFNLAEKLLSGDLDAYERQRRPIALEYVNTISAANKRNLETRDPQEQRRWREEMSRAASDPAAAREYVRRISMIASLKKAALLGLLLALVPLMALAQAFPSRPITIIVPFPPGSTSDLIPRAVAPVMSQSIGQPVVVENRPGATGSIGAAQVARGESSGHTVLMAPTPVLAINQWLYRDLGYNAEKDFVAVTNAASTPNLWVAHPSVAAANLKDLIALAKLKPNSISFASAGNGSTSHLCGELLKTSAEVAVVHVPYKGPGPAHQDLLSGRVPLMCDNLSNVLPHVRAGRLRAIALTALNRHPQAPEIPTAHESGLPGFDIGIWYGFVVPASTPKPAVQALHRELVKALRAPAVAERLDALGLTIIADSPDEFARLIAVESPRWRKLVQASGARLD